MNLSNESFAPSRWFRTALAMSVAAFACACGAAEPMSNGIDDGQNTMTESNAVTAAADGTISAKVLTVNGTGCPGGSATVVASPNADSFGLQFPGYTAALGGDATVAERRRNCQFMLDVSVPAGYTYALANTALSGSANLASGVSANATVSYYFQGSSTTVTATQPIPTGSAKWNATNTFPPDGLAYAPCDGNRNLALNTSIVLSGQSPASKSTASLDPNLTVQVKLKKCQ